MWPVGFFFSLLSSPFFPFFLLTQNVVFGAWGEKFRFGSTTNPNCTIFLNQQFKAFPWWLSTNLSVPVLGSPSFDLFSAVPRAHCWCSLLKYGRRIHSFLQFPSRHDSFHLTPTPCSSSLSTLEVVWSKLIGQWNPAHSKARLKIRGRSH